MGKLSKKANVKFAPSVIPVPSSKPAKKGKRNAEAALKKPVSAKRPKKEIQKVQLKQRDEKKLSKAPQPKKQLETCSSEDTSSESEEEVKITLKKGAKQPVKQEAMESSSSEDSSSDEESKLPRAAVSSKGLQNTGIKDNKFVSSKKDDSIDSSEFDSSSESDDSSSEFDSSSESNESSDSSEFDSSESDEENVTKTIAPSKKPTSVALPMKKSESSDSSDSESSDSSDSDSDEDEEVAAKVSATTKRVSAAPKKKVESTSSSESDSDSDEEDSCAIPTLEQLANNLEVIKKNTTDAIAKLYREFNTEHEKRKRLHTHIDQVEKDFSFDHSLILEHTKKFNNMDARVTANFDVNNREISQLKEKMNYLNTQLLHQNQIQASVPPTQPNTQDGFSAATPHPNMILVNRDVHYNMFNDGYEQALIKAARMGLLREESLQAPTLVSHGFNRLSELMQAFYFVEKTYSRRKYRKGSLEN